MKLELKHIAPYLWHGLEFIANDYSDILSDIWADNDNGHALFSSHYEAGDEEAVKLKNSPIKITNYCCTKEDNDFLLGCGENSMGYPIDDIYLSEVKPLLRPISDLTKKIEHNGEKFVPIKKMPYRMWANWLGGECLPYFSVEHTDELDLLEAIDCINLLAEWHFNYMNLDEILWIPKK